MERSKLVADSKSDVCRCWLMTLMKPGKMGPKPYWERRDSVIMMLLLGEGGDGERRRVPYALLRGIGSESIRGRTIEVIMGPAWCDDGDDRETDFVLIACLGCPAVDDTGLDGEI